MHDRVYTGRYFPHRSESITRVKDGSRHKRWLSCEIFIVFIRHLSNDFTLHRGD